MIWRKNILLTIIVFLLFIIPCKASTGKQLVLLVIDTTTLEELLKLPAINLIAENGVVGLVNTKSIAKNNISKSALTYGSGDKGEADFYLTDIYQSNDGYIKSKHIEIIKNINTKTLYGAVPGRLGSILKRSGLRTGFIGGVKYGNTVKAPAFFIAMDEKGTVDYGDISVLSKNGMNIREFNSVFDLYYMQCDFILLEISSINNIGSIDTLVQSLVSKLDFSKSTLCVLTLYSVYHEKEGLSPIVFYNGGKHTGVLSSDSTKRTGIITSQDFMHGVISYFGINNAPISNINILPLNNNIQYIKKMNQNILSVSSSRIPILRIFIILVVLMSLLNFLSFQIFRNINKAFFYIFNNIILTIPFSMLFESILRIEEAFYKGVFIFILSVVIVVLFLVIFKTPADRITAICAINICFLLFDICTGERMLKYSILSYDPIIGARFYGLGNEYMGVLIGSSIVLTYLLTYYKRMRVYGLLLLSFVSIFIGLPQFGANIGGLLTSIVALSLYKGFIYGHSLKKSLLFFLCSSAVMLLISILIDIMFFNGTSHLTRLFYHVILYDKTYFGNIIKRKMLMELQLIISSKWSFAVILLSILSLFFLIKPHFLKAENRFIYNRNKSLLQNSLITSIAAIMLNDSGIISAAFIMMYSIFSIIFISITNGR